MKFLSPLFFCCLLLAGALAQAHPQLIIATASEMEDNPSYEEMKDFLKEVFKDINIAVEYRTFPLKRGSILADSGKVDGELLRGKSTLQDHANLIKTSFPVIVAPGKIVSMKKNRSFNDKYLEKFKGACLRGNDEIISEARKLNMKMDLASSTPQLISMLLSERVDYIIGFADVIYHMAGKREDLVISKRDFSQVHYHFFLNKKHVELMPSIEKSLKTRIKGNMAKYKHIPALLNKNP